MPSRAEIRGTIEAVLRGVSMIVLAMMFWLSLDRGQPERVVAASSGNLAAAVSSWAASGHPPDRIAIQLDSAPSPVERDWMRALDRSGSRLEWKGNLPATAVSVEPIASPRGGLAVRAAAPAGNRIAIEDDLGLIEAASAQRGGASFIVPAASGAIVARLNGTRATSAPADSIRIGRVLLIGSAGWETKFVTSALEESGWKVDADISVAPAVDITQGSIGSIDTARYSAVVALDASAASRAGEITRYVANGGGLVLSGAAASIEAFAGLRAGPTGRAIVPSVVESEPGSITLESLTLIPVASPKGDALRIGLKNGSIAIAARRHGAGRVFQHGYVDTWRWRMSGGDTSPADHRDWWTKSVASVAYAPTVAHSNVSADNTPFAQLIASLGGPSSTPASLASTAGSISLWLLFAILSASLLGEWASRRLRGKR